MTFPGPSPMCKQLWKKLSLTLNVMHVRTGLLITRQLVCVNDKQDNHGFSNKKLLKRKNKEWVLQWNGEIAAKWQNPLYQQNSLLCRLTETQSNQLKPQVDLSTPKWKLIPRMSMLTLAISFLTTSNLPWFMDLTFQVPMQYCSLQHRTLLLSPVTSTAGYWFCFGSIPSFFLELFLHWSPVAYLSRYSK